MKRVRCLFAAAVMVAALGAQVNPALFAGMRWRNIGPFRGGRVSAVSGVSGQPGIYYMGTPGGGVWKTVDGGAVWTPIFDQITAVSSIGSLAVAPSDSNVVYVGTGDVDKIGRSVNEGDGIYKSTDAGKSWRHIGLENSHHIVALLVDPKNANIVLAATLGDSNAASADRGVFRSDDGGATWNKVLFRDESSGAVSIAWANDDPQVVLAAFETSYQRLGVGGRGAPTAPAIYRSTDEGLHWTPLTADGLPQGALGRVGVAIADHTQGRRMFAIVAGSGGRGAQGDAGLYRSDDGGDSWTRSTTDSRVVGNSYFSDVYVDTANPDIVYVMQTTMYRSTDGGHTFIGYKGAPGGEDQHVLWIDPANPLRMLLGSDQGATISLDGGESWTSWFNQATGQLYHLSADNRFPYEVYATQQDNGALETRSRGDLGQVSSLDWWPVAGYEFGYIVADPTIPNLIWVGGPAHGLERIDMTTGQWENVGPNIGPTDPAYRFATNPPLVFSPQDPHVLYEATQFVSMTRDQGHTWKNISPDLTAAPGSAGGGRGAALDTIAPSTLQANVIWAGSTNGVASVTRDAGIHWTTVTPPGVDASGDFTMIEAGHFDAGTAYAAVDRHLAGDFKPYLYVTTDYGQTWRSIAAGLPTDQPSASFLCTVREDTLQRGLLYAGSESGVYVSFDDGAHWQSLLLNLPTTSYRDMVVHGNDLVAATYGRALWILDDVTPLRQLAAKTFSAAEPVALLAPQTAIRVRRSVNRDMPNPPEIPHGPNPPDGAILDYYLATPPASPIRLNILDAQGRTIRSFSSTPEPAPPPANVPAFWLQLPPVLPAAAGENRFAWDLHLAPPPSFTHTYPNAAIVGNTPADPQGAMVPPGHYQVQLVADGKTLPRNLTVENDPRVTTPASVLDAIYALATRISAAMSASYEADEQLRAVAANSPPAPLEAALAPLMGGRGGRGGNPAGEAGFAALNSGLGSLLTTIEGADIPLTEPQTQAYAAYCAELAKALDTAQTALRQSGLPGLPALPTAPACTP